MRALLINCTLKPSPEQSNTEALAGVVVTGNEDGAHHVISEPGRSRPTRSRRRPPDERT